MKTTENAVRDRKGFARLTLVIVLIFAVMGASIWAVSKKTSDDMADAAILNLNENLNLMESTVEAIQDSEAQFQRLLATELAAAGDPGRRCGALGQKRCRRRSSPSCPRGPTSASPTTAPPSIRRRSISAAGAPRGLARLPGLCERRGQLGLHGEMSHERDGVPIAELYTEYTFDAIDQSLPQGLLRPAGRALSHGRRHGALRAEARGHGRA